MIREKIQEHVERATKKALASARAKVMRAVTKQLDAFDEELTAYDHSAGPILQKVCRILNCMEMDAEELVKALADENRKLKYQAQQTQEHLRKNKHYLGLVQALRDRAAATGDNQTMIMIDNFMISGL